jgi:superoxide dismutase
MTHNDMRSTINLVESTTLAPIKLDALPYKVDALEPVMSKSCVDVHYHILTRNYFKKYHATGDLFQRAGAVLHNDHYWPMMQPFDDKNKPSNKLTDVISESHQSLKQFKEHVLSAALGVQGNGWVLIMQDLQIQTVQNHVIKPGVVLAIDVWEHATVDHNYNRELFFKKFWNIVNWSKMEGNIIS